MRSTPIFIIILRILRALLTFYIILATILLFTRYILAGIHLSDDPYSGFTIGVRNEDVFAVVPWPLWVLVCACLLTIFLTLLLLLLGCIFCVRRRSTPIPPSTITGHPASSRLPSPILTKIRLTTALVLFLTFLAVFSTTAGIVFKSSVFTKCSPEERFLPGTGHDVLEDGPGIEEQEIRAWLKGWGAGQVCGVYKAAMWCCLAVCIFHLIDALHFIHLLRSAARQKVDPGFPSTTRTSTMTTTTAGGINLEAGHPHEHPPVPPAPAHGAWDKHHSHQHHQNQHLHQGQGQGQGGYITEDPINPGVMVVEEQFDKLEHGQGNVQQHGVYAPHDPQQHDQPGYYQHQHQNQNQSMASYGYTNGGEYHGHGGGGGGGGGGGYDHDHDHQHQHQQQQYQYHPQQY